MTRKFVLNIVVKYHVRYKIVMSICVTILHLLQLQLNDVVDLNSNMQVIDCNVKKVSSERHVRRMVKHCHFVHQYVTLLLISLRIVTLC